MAREHPAKSVFDDVDDWLDRIQLVDKGDEEIGNFLDSLDLHGPQEREMLEELARKAPSRGPATFPPHTGGRSQRWRRSAGTATARPPSRAG